MLPRGPADVAQAKVEGEEKPGFSHGRARRGKGKINAQALRSALSPFFEGDFE